MSDDGADAPDVGPLGALGELRILRRADVELALFAALGALQTIAFVAGDLWPLQIIAAACYWIDRWIVDGLVDLVGRIPVAFGHIMRGLQMGLVQFYALAMVLGMLILVAAKLMWAAG